MKCRVQIRPVLYSSQPIWLRIFFHVSDKRYTRSREYLPRFFHSSIPESICHGYNSYNVCVRTTSLWYMAPWILLICHDHLFLTHAPICTHTCTNIYMYERIPTCTYTRTNIYMYTHINIYMYTYQHIHAPTCTNIYQHHADQSRHTRTIKFCPCCHDIHTRMQSQHSKLTCIRGNFITIFIPRNQGRNDRNPSTILIRFLHTVCRPLQIAPVHY